MLIKIGPPWGCFLSETSITGRRPTPESTRQELQEPSTDNVEPPPHTLRGFHPCDVSAMYRCWEEDSSLAASQPLSLSAMHVLSGERRPARRSQGWTKGRHLLCKIQRLPLE